MWILFLLFIIQLCTKNLIFCYESIFLFILKLSFSLLYFLLFCFYRVYITVKVICWIRVCTIIGVVSWQITNVIRFLRVVLRPLGLSKPIFVTHGTFIFYTRLWRCDSSDRAQETSQKLWSEQSPARFESNSYSSWH